jgi:hypothetical protein
LDSNDDKKVLGKRKKNFKEDLSGEKKLKS